MGKTIQVKISKLGKIVTGKTPSSKFPDDFGNDILFATPPDFVNQKYIQSTERKLSNVGAEKLNSKLLPPDSVMVTCIGDIGRIALNKSDAITNQQINSIIVDKENFDPHYLYYALNHNKQALIKNAGKTVVPILNKAGFEEIEISIFQDKSEQQKIAAVLSALDAKIELNARINAELESMAKTLYDYWFVQFAPHKTAGGKMVWNDALKREIPLGWEVGTLEQIVKIRNGFAFKSEDYQEAGRLIIRTKNFDNNSIVLNDVVYISEENAKEYSDFELSKFDFLLVMVGASVGKSIITPSYILPALQNQNMWNFLPKNEKHKIYTNFLMSRIVKEQAQSANGSARDFFRKDHFYGLKIAIPDDSIVEEFQKITLPIFEKIDINISEAHTLTNLRDWLLPMLMNGQIKVA